MTNLNELLRMEHEVGTTNKPPKLMKVEQYLTWKDRFQSFIEYQDARMWICIEDGYANPTHDFEGRQRVTSYVQMTDNEKKMFEAEKRALAAIKMSLPDGIKHTFKKYTTSKQMWDALEKRYEGNEDVKKNKIDLLKKQFAVFKHMKNESLEEIITRYYHLMSEIDNYDIDSYTDIEINDKLLDALPSKWDIYTLMIKREADYEEKDLEEVIGMLRAYELNMKKKETGYDQVQDPGVYKGIPSSSSHNASSHSATAFLSCDNEQVVMSNSDGEVCYIAASGNSTGGRRQQDSAQKSNARSMPLSVKSAEDHLGLLASFIASYENYIQGKISDPTTFDEDYDQVDPDDLEEMDLQWQMAMISRRVKRFMNRTGRKFVGKSVGFDKTKVRCFNCQSYGHFARECQKEKTESSSQSSNNRNAGNNHAGSRALISTAREGSYDWSAHMEGDEVITQAFMAEVAEEIEKVDDEQTKETAQKDSKSFEEMETAYKKMAADLAALMTNADKPNKEVSSQSTTSVCLKCSELQGEVDRLLAINQGLVDELSNVKEANFFLKRNESQYLKKIKGYEAEIEVLTHKLNEKLQIIDLAHDTMAEKTKEVSDKCKELTEAEFKIIELEKKLGQLRDSSFVLKHMMGNMKNSNDRTCVGFNEVPPPSSHDYSSLPQERDLTGCSSTAPSSSTTNTTEGDDVKKENNKGSFPKKSKQVYVQKVNFVKGNDMQSESSVIGSQTNVEFVQNKNVEKPVVEQTKHSPSRTPSSTVESKSQDSVVKSLPKKSCFKCHTKGHVASGCPNKKVETQTNEKQKEKVTEEKSADGDKAEKGTQPSPRFQRNQQRFQPQSTSGRFDRPRSCSPRMNHCDKHCSNFRSQGQFQNRYQQNGNRTFYNNGFRNYNNPASSSPPRVQTNLGYHNQNSRPQGQNFQRSFSSNEQRSRGNQTSFKSNGPRSKTSDRSDGYWMDLQMVDEFGKPKTIKAWVPQSN